MLNKLAQEHVLDNDPDPALIDLQNSLRVQYLQERLHVLHDSPHSLCWARRLSFEGHGLFLAYIELCGFLVVGKKGGDLVVDALQDITVLACGDLLLCLLLVLLVHSLRRIKDCRRVLQVQ